MPKSKGSRSGSEPDREPFPTIDDAREKVQQAVKILDKLSEYRHPLAVRKGRARKEVDEMTKKRGGRQVRAGSRTYFIDVEKTREGKPYLKISESHFKGDEKDRERKTIIVFQEYAQEFADEVSDAVSEEVALPF